MNPDFANWDDKQIEDAIRAFTEGAESDEVAHLESELGFEDLHEFEAAIAAIQWSHTPQMSPPPSQLMETLKAQGAAWVEQENDRSDLFEIGASPSVRQVQPRRTPWAAITGWAAAAALLVVLAAGKLQPSSTELGVADRFAALADSAQDLVRVPWANTEDPASEGVSGEVIWSDAAQEGYMVFSGLAANNPTQEQYQLWVFDPTRADWEKLPVDGGVFDVEAATTQDGKVIVPIRPTLPVQDIALFAITVEKPGGVVVSKREKLILTASPS